MEPCKLCFDEFHWVEMVNAVNDDDVVTGRFCKECAGVILNAYLIGAEKARKGMN